MSGGSTRIGAALVVVQFLVVAVLWLSKSDQFTTASSDYFDVAHYHSISTIGYADFQLAFFPGFPGFWKLSGLGILGIALVNMFVYFGSLWYLSKTFQWSTKGLLLAALGPSLVFYCIPYTEAFFFAAAVWILVGIHKGKLLWTAIGLFVCALIRPTVSVLIIGLLLLEILRSETFKDWLKRSSLWMVSGVGGVLCAFLIQFLMTGKWFEFFEAQRLWGNELQWPQFPLSSWAGPKIVLLDAAALAVGMLSIIMVLRWVFLRLNRGRLALQPTLVLSALYLAGVTGIVLLFRGGELFSLNRFVFASPFFLVVLVWVAGLEWKKVHLWVIGGLFLFFTAFGSFGHIQTTLSFLALTFGLSLPMFFNHPQKVVRYSSLSIFTVGLLIVQIALILRFLNGEWIG